MATFAPQSDSWTTLSNNNSGVEVGNEGGAVNGALRFTSVTIAQGTTIQSADLRFSVGVKGASTGNIKYKIYGIDEDNNGDFSGSPMGRSKTDAVTTEERDLEFIAVDDFLSSGVTAIVQEIVNRAGWSSGNAMGFILEDNGSPDTAWIYDSQPGASCQLVITLASPSASISPSPSRSPSASISPTASASVSPSSSPSPSRGIGDKAVLRVAKPGVNVLTNQLPHKFIFSSDYGTLKYFQKTTTQIQIDGSTGDFAGTTTVTHSLGYYPFVEVFVRVYIGSPAGDYEYCPFFGSGASVAYSANFKITTTGIVLYAEFNGVSASVWNFDFIVFVYKNNLLLS